MDTPRIFAAIAPGADGSDPLDRALAAARAESPYLARLADQRPGTLAACASQGAAAVVEAAIAAARAATDADVMAALRQAKADTHLALALGDLAGVLSLDDVTGGLTRLADAAVGAALAAASAALAEKNELTTAGADLPGLVVLAMGKHGAGELNYSSDIDVTLFFDRDRFPAAPGKEAQRVAVRLAQAIVRILEEPTPEGYVFRTDLRLRPDPGATPVVVSTAAASHYYQTLGQNWERAAFIKARPIAGDVEAGRAFLASLEPFIWRRHLDFAAIDDIRSIKRQILAVKDGRADLDEPACDVKLGRGGIRDIELFAQTTQLILGGRNRALRSPRTLDALASLAEAGAITPEARDRLSGAYVFFRGVEHRIQMLEDAQTHRLPVPPEARGRVARLAGYSDLARFDAAIAAARRIVVAEDSTLFAPEDSLAAPEGQLVFTGVEDDPDTLETLRRMGFSAPEKVTAALRGWHHGRLRATRSERARELLTRLTPRLLRALAATAAADLAFQRFELFLSSLPAGVQALALLDARADVLDTLAGVLALAPELAAQLARTPATLDAMSERRFFAPLEEESEGARRADALAVVEAAGGFEAALNALRRHHREEQFRIDLQMLERIAAPEAAGRAHSDLADACVAAVASCAAAETRRRFGDPPGPFMIAGLGKLGGRELAHGSDLDLTLIYDASPQDAGAAEYFGKLTQRIVTGLSAQTEEGALYPVDLQLRPSGKAGPVAVRFSSFERYYGEDAWTWELQALTRLRPVAGDPALSARVTQAAAAALARPRDPERLLADVAAMRGKMDRERPPSGPWDLKLRPGGLVDVEFLAQGLMLVAAREGKLQPLPNTGDALTALSAAGLLAPERAKRLLEAWRFFSAARHVLRVAAEGRDPEEAGAPLMRRLAQIVGVVGPEALAPARDALAADVRKLFVEAIGPTSGS